MHSPPHRHLFPDTDTLPANDQMAKDRCIFAEYCHPILPNLANSADLSMPELMQAFEATSNSTEKNFGSCADQLQASSLSCNKGHAGMAFDIEAVVGRIMTLEAELTECKDHVRQLTNEKKEMHERISQMTVAIRAIRTESANAVALAANHGALINTLATTVREHDSNLMAIVRSFWVLWDYMKAVWSFLSSMPDGRPAPYPAPAVPNCPLLDAIQLQQQQQQQQPHQQQLQQLQQHPQHPQLSQHPQHLPPL